MKVYLFLIVSFLGLSKCFAQDDSLPIILTLKIDKEYVRSYSKKLYSTEIRTNSYVIKSDSVKQKYFDISLEIKNISDKTIKIWLMSCSWDENFIVNNNYIFINGHDCDKNFPDLVEFKPGESKVYTNTLFKSIKFDYPCKNCIYGPQVETTKLGLIIIDDIFNSTDTLDYDIAMGDKSKWKMVWSNPLYLLTKNESSPKPLVIPVYLNKGQF